MTQPTQAHLTRRINKNQSGELLAQTKSQMEYYMGAKLIEVGVNPPSALYRWSVSTEEGEHVWTLSAYWGEDKEKLLSGKMPLAGIELIDCARANAASGLATAARLCGYGEDVAGFQTALQQAGARMGVNLESLRELIERSAYLTGDRGIDVAPDTDASL